MRSRETRLLHAFAAASTLLALGVRLFWIFRIQSPYRAVYSDMNGYVERARALVAGTTTSFPRLTALYPYGAHYVYAAVFRVFGYEHQTAVCIVQAVLCSIPVYFFVLFASRFFAKAWVPLVLGVVFAVWQPVVWCTGYFLSETPYLALLFLNAWLCLRFAETKRSGFALGLTAAVLFTVRPQFILTFGLLAMAHVWKERRRLFRIHLLRPYMLVALPWLFVLPYGVVRYHRLTGRWGLISENGQLNRLFADTTVGRVEGRWIAPNGDYWSFTVEPPCKPPLGETEVVRIDGYMGDPDTLSRIRAEHLRGKSLGWRLYRTFNNVRLLWDLNDPWPERDGARKDPFRGWAQRWFNEVARWVVIPLACLGVVVLRKRTALVVVLAHLVTLVILSMFFLAEARYRVPYDPFLILVAVAGTARLTGLLRASLARRRSKA